MGPKFRRPRSFVRTPDGLTVSLSLPLSAFVSHRVVVAVLMLLTFFYRFEKGAEKKGGERERERRR